MAEKGIDISYAQKDIDWKTAKEKDGLTFAIIRTGYGRSTRDKMFERHIEGALSAGIAVGVYHFAYAHDVADATREAAFCLNVIEKYKDSLRLPVYYDYEYDTERYLHNLGIIHDKIKRSDVMFAFCDYVKSHGLKAGVYTNLDYIKNRLPNDFQKAMTARKLSLWLALYNENQNANMKYGADVQQVSSTKKLHCYNNRLDYDLLYDGYRATPISVLPFDYTTPQDDVEKNTGSAYESYIVKRGDTLSGIASRFGLSYKKIAKDNNIDNPNLIYPKQVLKIYK